MADPSNQSFIPKNTARTKRAKSPVRRIYVFAYISYTIFVATILAAGGVFVYQLTAESNLASQREQLAAEEELFSQADIAQVREYEQRLQAAEERFANQLPVSGIFRALERVVASGVTLTEFTLTRDQQPRAAVTLAATTDDFNSVLFQRTAFQEEAVTEGAQITDVSISQQNDPNSGAEQTEVTFNIGLNVAAQDVPFSESSASARSSGPATASDINVATSSVPADTATNSDEL